MENKVKIIFCQGVYLAENTSQAASVESVRFLRTDYARSRLQNWRKSPKGFFDKLKQANGLLFPLEELQAVSIFDIPVASSVEF